MDDLSGSTPQTTPPATPPVIPPVPSTPPITSSVETPPVTPPVTSPATPAPLDQKTVDTLKDQITQDVSTKVTGEVSKGVLQKIADALGLSKKEEDKLPTNAEELKTIVDQKVQEAFDKMSQQMTDEEEQSETVKEERVNQIVTTWYSQYNQLAKMGKVPAITKADDANDKGVIARRKLIQAIGRKIEQNKKEGITYTPSISDILLENPKVLTGPPGADLPISGDTTMQQDTKSFTNKEIREKSFAQIANEGAS